MDRKLVAQMERSAIRERWSRICATLHAGYEQYLDCSMSGLTREQRVAGVGALLCPANIAIVGASDRPGSWSGGVRRALQRSGFAREGFPVQPRHPARGGRGGVHAV